MSRSAKPSFRIMRGDHLDATEPVIAGEFDDLLTAAFRLGFEEGFEAGDGWPELSVLWVESLNDDEWKRVEIARH